MGVVIAIVIIEPYARYIPQLLEHSLQVSAIQQHTARVIWPPAEHDEADFIFVACKVQSGGAWHGCTGDYHDTE